MFYLFLIWGFRFLKASQNLFFLRPFADWVLKNFDAWRGRFFFFCWQVCLINSVITFVHSFMIYCWPRELLWQMFKATWNFLWSGSVRTFQVNILRSWKFLVNVFGLLVVIPKYVSGKIIGWLIGIKC